MRSLFGLIVWGLCSWTLVANAAEPTVTLTKVEGDVYVTIDGKPFTALSTSKAYPKPFFHPVHAADGTIITRDLVKNEDHPHHKGIWCSVDEVNGLKFWAEKARIENQSVEIGKSNGPVAELKYVNHWLKDDGTPLLVESTTVRISPKRLMAFDFTLAATEPATFRDTKEGLFGIRVANSLREKEGGTITNSEGQKGMKDCWGKTGPWVDYFGPVNGKTYGVALFDHPGNFRKSRYHVRDYGLFTISPFGPKSYTNGQEPEAPVTVEPGKPLRLRFGLYVHDGDTAAGKVGETHAEYLKLAGE
jgi:hypothetical protein